MQLPSCSAGRIARPLRHVALQFAIALAAIPLLAPVAAEAASGTASLVIDVHSGRTLHARNADAPRYPASLTKIMTLYMVFDLLKQGKIGMDTRWTASANAAAQVPSKIGIKAGNSITVRDAIRALVTKSANDVAVVVAENIGGTEENFARMMTAKARAMGMSRTTFRNASGLPNSEQISTARDLSILGLRIMRDFPQYYAFFSTRNFSYAGANHRNHNRMLVDYAGTDGIKTGFTRASGFNLVASVRRDDRHLVGVVLGGNTAAARNATMRRLLDQNFPQALALNALRNVPVPTRNPIALAVAAKPQTPSFAAASATSSFAPPTIARLAAPAPQPPVEEGDAASTATHHVQVGAYTNEGQAGARILAVQQVAGDLVGGHAGVTVPTRNTARPLFRARFADFSEHDAGDVCTQLKQRNIDCIVMPAE